MSQIVLQHYRQPKARRHLWIGILMSLVATGFLISQSVQWLSTHPTALAGLQASLLAGLATGLGAIPAFFIRRPQAHWIAPMLGLAGGMMIAASLFSLLVPAVEWIGEQPQPLHEVWQVMAGLILGCWVMQHLDRRTEHAHVENLEAMQAKPALALVVAAIALHNLPEGLAVSIATTAGADHGMSIGIALQNLPEGWIVASALILLGRPPLQAALLALATGLMEPVGGLFGALAGSYADALIPFSLCAAAGAMLWVVSHELIPASHKPGQEAAASSGLILGFALMTGLATLL